MSVIRLAALVIALALQGCAPTIPTQYGRTLAPSLMAMSDMNGAFPGNEETAARHYLGERELDPIEGIWTWDNDNYQVAIVRNESGIEPNYDYVGIVVRSNYRGWESGQLKLLLNATASPSIFTGVYYTALHKRTNLSYITSGPNVIEVNHPAESRRLLLIRDYPATPVVAAGHGQKGESRGTCFIASPNGLAVTSHHVVDGATQISVTLADGQQVSAAVISRSAANDVAILQLATATPDYLALVSSRSAQLGEPVFTVGYPSIAILGPDAKFTEGSISALSGIHGEAAYMQVSVPVQPGNSGGPVVNHRGDVVGVIAATAAVETFYQATGSLPQNVNWAVKSDYVRPMLDDVPPVAASASRSEAISRVQQAVCQVTASP